MTSDHIHSRLWPARSAGSSVGDRVAELGDRVPHLGDAGAGEGRAGEHPGGPRRRSGPHEVEGGGVVGGGVGGDGGEIAVGLVDDDEIGELHDPALEPLELVAAAGRHEHEEEVDHRRDLHLRLADADGLDQHDVEAGGLAQQQRFAGAPGDAAERPAGRRRPHERVR